MVGHGIGQHHDDHLLQHRLAAAAPEGGAYSWVVICGQHVVSMGGVIGGDNGTG